jgi:hypothetical protein
MNGFALVHWFVCVEGVVNVFGFSFSVFAEDGPWGFAAVVVSVAVLVGALLLLPVTQTGESLAQAVGASKKSNVFDYCWPATIFGCDSEEDLESDVPAARLSADGKADDEAPVAVAPAAPLRNPVAVAAAARTADKEMRAKESPSGARRNRPAARRGTPRSGGREQSGGHNRMRASVLPKVGPNRFAAACQTLSKRQFRGPSGGVCVETVYRCGRGAPKETSKFCS